MKRTVGAAAGAATVSMAGCLGGDGGGTEGVRVPGLYDTSGATSDVGLPSALGGRDGINYINDNDLLDLDIDHEWVDYAYDVEEAVRAYDDFVSESFPPAIIGWGTADTEALAPQVAEDEVVYISASYSENLMAPENDYNFFGNLDYSSQGRIHLEWINSNDPGSKVSFIHHNSPFGLSPVEPGEAYAEELGLEVGPRFELPSGASSAESQLRRAREEDVEYLIHQNVAAPMQVLVADRQEVYPEVEIMGLTYTTDELRVEQSPEAFEGVRYVSAFKTFDEALESGRGGDAIQEMFDEYRDESLDDREVANLNYVRGFIHSLLVFRALSNVQEMDLDPTVGADFREGMFAIEEWDGWGLIEPLTYSQGDRRPTMTGRVYEVRDGEMQFDEKFELERRTEWISG